MVHSPNQTLTLQLWSAPGVWLIGVMKWVALFFFFLLFSVPTRSLPRLFVFVRDSVVHTRGDAETPGLLLNPF